MRKEQGQMKAATEWLLLMMSLSSAYEGSTYLPLLLPKYLSRRITVWVLGSTWYTKMVNDYVHFQEFV